MKYEPHNGAEEMQFRDKFCDRCRHDNPRKKTGCKILLRALTGGAPEEWITDEQGPRCTAFEASNAHRGRKSDKQLEFVIDVVKNS